MTKSTTPDDAVHGDGNGVGIDEFARRCGTTVRLVREYQTLGVLPPPERVGRTAVYGEAHAERWRAVTRLQERGYSLAAIADLFEAWETGSSLPAVLGVSNAAVGALDETPVLVDGAQLEAELPAIFGKPSLVRRAVKAGLVHRGDDGRYVVRSPALVQLVADALAAGIPAAKAVSIVEAIDEHTDEIAGTVLEVLGQSITAYDPAEHGDLLRRGRSLLAQAVASVLIDHVGTRFERAADRRPDVAKLIEDLRIGAVHDTSGRPAR